MTPSASAAFSFHGRWWLRNRQHSALSHFTTGLNMLLCFQVHHQIPHLFTQSTCGHMPGGSWSIQGRPASIFQAASAKLYLQRLYQHIRVCFHTQCAMSICQAMPWPFVNTCQVGLGSSGNPSTLKTLCHAVCSNRQRGSHCLIDRILSIKRIAPKLSHA